MKLDKRIIEGKKPLTCFDTEQAKEFLGKECYFSNCKVYYKNLSAFEKFESLTDYCIGTLTAIMHLGDRVFCVDQQCKEFRYCLPCEWVKEPEKRYRPYTLNEFVNQYSLGDEVIVRLKDKENISHKLFVEYDENDDDAMVCLGSIWYELTELYDSFEIYTGGGWKPFGVEIKDGE